MNTKDSVQIEEKTDMILAKVAKIISLNLLLGKINSNEENENKEYSEKEKAEIGGKIFDDLTEELLPKIHFLLSEISPEEIRKVVFVLIMNKELIKISEEPMMQILEMMLKSVPKEDRLKVLEKHLSID